jgi:anti-sigma factor RsiW
MTCRECRELIPAWVDRELSPRDGDSMEGHLLACEDCRLIAMRERSFLEGLRAQLPRESMPADVKARILARVEEAVEGQPSRHAWRRGVMALAGLALMLGPLVFFAPRMLGSRDWTSAYFDEQRAAPGAGPLQHPSASPGELTAWFKGNLGQALHVPEMPDARLLGGRICVLNGKAVGLAVYESAGNRMNLFIGDVGALCPGGFSRAEGELYSVSRPGASLVAWKHNGHFHVVVSGLSVQSLQALARECQNSPASAKRPS